MALLSRLRRWYNSLSLPWRRWRIVGYVDAPDDTPERLPARGAFLIGDRESPNWVVMECPCRTGHVLMLNLAKSRYPCWQVTDTESLTIYPSVDSTSNARRCHFVVSNGKIRWAADGLNRSREVTAR